MGIPPVVALVGRPDCGKTTLLEKLLPELRRRGYRVGTIKHHVHEFAMDTPGKDTWRHKQAGAHTVALSSPTGIGLVRDADHDAGVEELAARYFSELDLVLAEGYKQTALPKIEVYRQALHPEPLAGRDASWIALVSDTPLAGDLPCFTPDQVAEIADLLERRFLAGPSLTRQPIAAVILAGGRSSRFSGNKALALYRGRPLIEHAAGVLAELFPERLLVTNTPAEYAFLGWPMTADLTAGAGPLAGIQAALEKIEAPRAFITACDMPRLDPGLIRRLCACPGDWDVVLPAPDDRREPLHALYHRRILPEVNAALSRGERRLGDLLARLRVRELSGPELELDPAAGHPFVNVNCQRDLEALQQQERHIPTLAQARQLLFAHLRPGATECLPLAAALDRIPATAVRARLAVPSFPQASRDGYALRAADSRPEPVSLTLQGEIAAGRREPPARLQAGAAYRIMTGGLVPPGADCVVPFEEVADEGRQAIVLRGPCRPGSHIRPAGTDLRRHQVIVRAGRRIEPAHLPLLATAGVGEIELFTRPRVGLLCTGSELLDDPGANPAAGRLISGNRFLLAGLIRRCGAEPVDLGTARDDRTEIAAMLAAQRGRGLEVIISTGGLGPGKYDLVARALEELRAPILYRQLRVRPGKTTLAAWLDGTLFFGLPGPPPAVHLLFLALIAPALRRLQGDAAARPAPLKARLLHPLEVRPSGVLHLKEAVLRPAGDRLTVRSPRPGEALNAVMVVPAHRRAMGRHELISVLTAG